MQLRRRLVHTAGALLMVGALSSCGFDLMTDQPYTPGEGTNDRDGAVKVLSAMVVAAQPNEGTFIATLANDSQDTVALTGVSGETVEVDDAEPIELAPRQAVNLANGGGMLVTGDFDAGDFLTLTLTYDNGETSELDLPVVTACEEYEGLDLTEGSQNIPYDCDFEPEKPEAH